MNPIIPLFNSIVVFCFVLFGWLELRRWNKATEERLNRKRKAFAAYCDYILATTDFSKDVILPIKCVKTYEADVDLKIRPFEYCEATKE